MKRSNLWLFLALALTLVLIAPMAFAQETSLTIKEPKDGGVIKGDSVKIDYTYTKGTQGDHLHIYLDGKRAKVQYGEPPVELKDLSKGAHEIEVRAAAKAHAEFGPKASFKFTVE